MTPPSKPTSDCCSKGCACATAARPSISRLILWGMLLLACWFALYLNLASASAWFTYNLLKLPQGLMASVMGKGAWWSVPAAVLVGVPMYSNAAGIMFVGYLFNFLM